MQLLLNTIMLEPNRWTADHELSRPLVDLLEPIAEAGFDALELWGYHVDRLSDSQVEDLARALDTRSMRAVGIGAYPSFHLEGGQDDEQRQRLDRLVDIGARLGSRVFKIFPGRVGGADADDTVWRRSVERMRQLSEHLGEHGMVLTLETHGGTLCDTLGGTRRLLEQLPDVDRVGVCFQPYIDDDTDAAIAVFEALKSRVLHIHLQNRASREVTLLEEGDWTDYGRFLPHVKAAGFDGPLCIEFTAGITPRDGEDFDVATVLDSAVQDRRFIERAWSTVSARIASSG